MVMEERNYNLLIVDDDESILLMLEALFMNTAYEVKTVNDPFAAYHLIENEHFDIVISDIAMPVMDGLTLLRKIKQFNGMIQVIMMTAYITINNTLNAFRYGAIDIFFKPFDDVEEIVGAVDDIAVKLNRVNKILSRVAKEKGLSNE